VTERAAELAALTKVSAHDVAANRRRGGDIRVVLSPKTAGSTSGFMGTLTLAPGEYVTEHCHPYSEEFLYLVEGKLTAQIESVREIDLAAGEALMIPRGLRHRVRNAGQDQAHAVFHISPLAPRPELGHLDTEPRPGIAAIEPIPDAGDSH